MSRFLELKQELEECACTECFGDGVIAEWETSSGEEETCTVCKSSGINPGFGISLDIDRAQ
jgi:hypothetical protein